MIAPMEAEDEQLRRAVTANIDDVQRSVVKCLALPSVAPWVNAAGVRAFLKSVAKDFESPNAELRDVVVQVDATTQKYVSSLQQLLPPGGRPSDETVVTRADVIPRWSTRIVEALIDAAQTAASSPKGQVPAALSTTDRSWQELMDGARRSVAEPRLALLSDAAHTEAVRVLLKLHRQLERHVAAVTSILSVASQGANTWFGPIQRKVRELHDLSQWYEECFTAAAEWTTEHERRVAATQRVAARAVEMKRELDQLVDEENMARQVYEERYARYLPKNGFPGLGEVLEHVTMKPPTRRPS